MLAFPAPYWRQAVVSSVASPRNPRPMSTFGRSATRILPRLYLSDWMTARDSNALSTLGITHVVSVLEHAPVMPGSIPEERRLHVCIADRSDVDILSHFEETTAFIQKALAEDENHRVLVHCVQGISRSATIICAYMIATAQDSMTATEALGFVQGKRSIVCPNLGFRTQLEEYATRFVGGRERKGSGRGSRISSGIAERIRRLRTGSPRTSRPSPDGKASMQEI